MQAAQQEELHAFDAHYAESGESSEVPGGLTAFEFDHRLEKWIKFHKDNLMAASLDAPELPRDVTNAQKFAFHIVVQYRPEPEHNNKAAKYFRITTAEVLPMSAAKARGPGWRAGLADFEKLREDRERQNQGTVSVTCVTCDPLNVQSIPFGSIGSNMEGVRINKDWKVKLLRDVEAGRKFGGW